MLAPCSTPIFSCLASLKTINGTLHSILSPAHPASGMLHFTVFLQNKCLTSTKHVLKKNYCCAFSAPGIVLGSGVALQPQQPSPHPEDLEDSWETSMAGQMHQSGDSTHRSDKESSSAYSA